MSSAFSPSKRTKAVRLGGASPYSLTHAMAYTLFSDYTTVRRCLRNDYLRTDTIDEREQMLRLEFSGLFVARVMSECRAHGVTPWSADTGTLRLDLLLSDVEAQLPTTHDSYIQRFWSDYEMSYLRRQRRQFAYSVLLRLTSGAVSA
jgi:hypothetical protein